MDGDPRGKGPGEQIVLPGLADGPILWSPDRRRDGWIELLHRAIAERSPNLVTFAERALREFPGYPELLMLAALAAVVGNWPDRALVYLRRFRKRFEACEPMTLLSALAIAQRGQYSRAATILSDAGLTTFPEARPWFVGDETMADWLRRVLARIEREAGRERAAAARAAKAKTLLARRQAKKKQPIPQRLRPEPAAAHPVESIADLPRLDVALDISFELSNGPAIQIEPGVSEPDWFRLRAELVQLGLVEGFDELLCLPTLRDVETHAYQIETVRKVLKQFRGRVLLADEVGLGKTIEAGMVLKEYMLRGMAERVLILTPAAMVGQWRDEMEGKFGIACLTSHDPLLRSDPVQFWANPVVIASIAAARRKEHAALLAGISWDVVVVDEAHHLKDQSSASYQLVNSLQKRFVLLLSATPVQNNLVELYNLLTLLQPGIFKTQREFRAAYMTRGKPREPANRDRLRDLMRGVMIRNTRALAALRLPHRHAATLRVTPGQEEAVDYRELTALVRETAASGQTRLALQQLLGAAGSSPAAAAAAIARSAERHPDDARWMALHERYRAHPTGAKEAALLNLLAQNPAEKKIVFVHYRDSLADLARLLRRKRIPFAIFEGGMSGQEKDAAIDAFRDSVPLLLSSESGGEGRNLQFCNTLINFDIPWNPMAIEQRIGRIDRIGQTREVFVFNLATGGTVEDRVLQILDEKINMFELVVGEIGAIVGELDEQSDFSNLILDAWLQTSEEARQSAFAALEDELVAARRKYQDAKALDDALFGDELEAA